MVVMRADARAKLQRHVRRHRQQLLLDAFVGHGLPLHPPTARAAASDEEGTRRFIRDWEGVSGVVWEERNWTSAGVGRHLVPVRLHLDTVAGLVREAGLSVEWADWVERRDLLMQAGCDREAVVAAVSLWADLETSTLETALNVVAWFRDRPGVSVLPRAVAVEGVDTKWLERHRSLVETLLAAIRGVVGRDALGLLAPPARVRMRFHPGEGPGGLCDVEVPVEELSAVPPPHVILMVENLSSFLALPTWPGVVLVWGGGYWAVTLVAHPWFRSARLVYWGDLDADGFAILSGVRGAHGDVTSVLMDVDTVRRWARFGVPDRKFQIRAYPGLTAIEGDAVDELIMAGQLRIEQERIRFDVAVETIEGAVERAAVDKDPTSVPGSSDQMVGE
ncbi:Wadjet anti-phage system protein JetD domain-containing protein [Corynebacterium sp.]|uniref:Wadjet anti-phage system protein JetD domain-containing protein n=1 Tax=Corynebacterium sp. TaxID=1720 RepID=UPI0026DFB757|nr:Wadjet anti-phage system protein JetD domain-containing protein [Corynebacterium sp.]MDO5512435.1 DUF2220 family protein [Corynebacterium sp.]